jgi:transaldolase
LHQLSELGQSVWIDFLSRQMLQSGKLAQMMEEDAVVGVTSNPTIFQKAISQGDAYDEQLREVLAEEEDAKEVFLKLAVQDVRNACDLLRPVWDAGRGQDGYVSIEVDPNLAYDTEGTIAEAQRLHDLVDKPNCFVKIPATEPGLPAIEEMIARGRNINITLIFSLSRYAAVVQAYLTGLERLVASGGDPTRVASVASFFVSRVDTEADRRLDEADAPDELKGKLAVANAKLAYERYQELFSGERWEPLAAKGATKQRCLWASTSTKNPDYRDVIYVEELIGPETVNTMPEETITAFQDHGAVELTLERDVDEAKQASSTPTWSRRWSARASRSSPTRSRSCSKGCGPSAASSSRPDRRRDGDLRGGRGRGAGGRAHPRGHLRQRDVGGAVGGLRA